MTPSAVRRATASSTPVWFRAPTTTVAPAAPRWRAIAKPSPLVPPVTTATFPVRPCRFVSADACHFLMRPAYERGARRSHDVDRWLRSVGPWSYGVQHLSRAAERPGSLTLQQPPLPRTGANARIDGGSHDSPP